MELQFPDNQVVQYKVPIIRIEWYSIKEILEKEFRDIRELISKIVEYSFPESKNVRKGLGEIMGGQVLELESDRLIKKGTDDMAALTRKLMDEGCLDDLRRCTEDSAYRKKLLNEMQGIL